MRIATRTAGLASVLLAAAAGSAWAFGPFTNTQVCGGASFYTCVTLTSQYDATTNTLTLTVRNDGLGTLGTIGVAPAIPTSGTPFTGYGALGVQNELSGAGDLGYTYYGFNAANTPDGLAVGETGTFVFVFDAGFDDNIANLALGLHMREGPNDFCSSNKLYIAPDNSTTPATGGAYAEGCGPTTVIPEPITMSLLATGLAGMGGVGFLRRRRQR